jgi:hypothetical protein
MVRVPQSINIDTYGKRDMLASDYEWQDTDLDDPEESDRAASSTGSDTRADESSRA